MSRFLFFLLPHSCAETVLAACQARNGTHKQCYHWILSHGTDSHLLTTGKERNEEGLRGEKFLRSLQFSRAASPSNVSDGEGASVETGPSFTFTQILRCICNGWQLVLCVDQATSSHTQCRLHLQLPFWLQLLAPPELSYSSAVASLSRSRCSAHSFDQAFGCCGDPTVG